MARPSLSGLAMCFHSRSVHRALRNGVCVIVGPPAGAGGPVGHPPPPPFARAPGSSPWAGDQVLCPQLCRQQCTYASHRCDSQTQLCNFGEGHSGRRMRDKSVRRVPIKFRWHGQTGRLGGRQPAGALPAPPPKQCRPAPPGPCQPIRARPAGTKPLRRTRLLQKQCNA